MDITGQHTIPADRETVWAALNDPDVLRQCIPGCQELSPTDSGYEAKVVAAIGPVKATFTGTVQLEDVNAPESYVIVGGGKGGQAGFARGRAQVTLDEAAPGTTRLSYSAEAQVGGKLAQVGSRLVQGTAQKYAEEFFSCFAARVAPAEAPGEAPAAAGTEAPAPEPPAPAAVRWAVWAVLVLGTVGLLLLLLMA